MTDSNRCSALKTGDYCKMLHTALLLSAMVFGLILIESAHARVVGIVFDDSGSMKHNIHLPTFGAQLLVATLDGSNGGDQLYTTRFSQFMSAFEPHKKIRSGRLKVPTLPIPFATIGPDSISQLLAAASHELVKLEAIDSRSSLQATIDRIATEWPDTPRAETPYEPVEVMLNTLAENSVKDEEAFLIIFSDGAFYDGATGMVPPQQHLLDNYARYKARMRGPLTVFFILTVNGSNVVTQVEEQGVRAALLETFNGAPEEGYLEVNSFDRLLEAMLEVIAAVSSTSVADSSEVLRVRDSQIDLSLPVTVTKIISLSISEEARTPPKVDEIDDFDVVDRVDVTAAMRQGDNRTGEIKDWPTTKLRGEITRLIPRDPLQRGSVAIPYDRLIGKNDTVRLLFRSHVFVEIEVVDKNSNPVAVDADGRLLLLPDEPYFLRYRVYERFGGKRREVDQTTLPRDTRYLASWGDGTERKERPMRVDPVTGIAKDPITFDTERTDTVEAQVIIDALANSQKAKVRVKTEETRAQFDVAMTGIESCDPPCDGNEFVATYRFIERPETLAHLDVSIFSKKSGTFIASLEKATDLVLLAPDGESLRGRALDFAPDIPVRLSIARTPQWRVGAGQPQEIDLVLRTMGPLDASLRKTYSLRPLLPPVKITYLGATDGVEDGSPAPLALLDLGQADNGLRFQLDNVHGLESEPDDANHADRLRSGLDASGAHFLLTYDIDVQTDGDAYLATVHPVVPALLSTIGCACFIPNGEYPIELAFNPGSPMAKATGQGAITVAATWLTRFGLCGLFLLVVLAVAWLLTGIWAFLTADRFPNNAFLRIEERDADFPRNARLDESGWSLLRKNLFWWYFRFKRHESVQVPGTDLIFTARRRGGVWIRPTRRGIWPAFKLDGEDLRDRATQTGREDILVGWDDQLVQTTPVKRTLTVERRA